MRYLILAAVVAILVLLIAVPLLRSREGYTELAFDTSVPLPQSVNATGSYPFAFVIHNVEGLRRPYTFAVSETVDDVTTPILTQTAVLAPDETVVVRTAFPVNASFKRMHVDVQLTGMPVRIGFWVTGPSVR